ncbi:MAG: hypothetical protein M1831_002318 [Alyxoria varia]|nr:MAG: hypothetical protein M1831_002318 [Alyxoria varia]
MQPGAPPEVDTKAFTRKSNNVSSLGGLQPATASLGRNIELSRILRPDTFQQQVPEEEQQLREQREAGHQEIGQRQAERQEAEQQQAEQQQAEQERHEQERDEQQENRQTSQGGSSVHDTGLSGLDCFRRFSLNRWDDESAWGLHFDSDGLSGATAVDGADAQASRLSTNPTNTFLNPSLGNEFPRAPNNSLQRRPSTTRTNPSINPSLWDEVPRCHSIERTYNPRPSTIRTNPSINPSLWDEIPKGPTPERPNNSGRQSRSPSPPLSREPDQDADIAIHTSAPFEIEGLDGARPGTPPERQPRAGHQGASGENDKSGFTYHRGSSQSKVHPLLGGSENAGSETPSHPQVRTEDANRTRTIEDVIRHHTDPSRPRIVHGDPRRRPPRRLIATMDAHRVRSPTRHARGPDNLYDITTHPHQADAALEWGINTRTQRWWLPRVTASPGHSPPGWRDHHTGEAAPNAGQEGSEDQRMPSEENVPGVVRHDSPAGPTEHDLSRPDQSSAQDQGNRKVESCQQSRLEGQDSSNSQSRKSTKQLPESHGSCNPQTERLTWRNPEDDDDDDQQTHDSTQAPSGSQSTSNQRSRELTQQRQGTRDNDSRQPRNSKGPQESQLLVKRHADDRRGVRFAPPPLKTRDDDGSKMCWMKERSPETSQRCNRPEKHLQSEHTGDRLGDDPPRKPEESEGHDMYQTMFAVDALLKGADEDTYGGQEHDSPEHRSEGEQNEDNRTGDPTKDHKRSEEDVMYQTRHAVNKLLESEDEGEEGNQETRDPTQPSLERHHGSAEKFEKARECREIFGNIEMPYLESIERSLKKPAMQKFRDMLDPRKIMERTNQTKLFRIYQNGVACPHHCRERRESRSEKVPQIPNGSLIVYMGQGNLPPLPPVKGEPSSEGRQPPREQAFRSRNTTMHQPHANSDLQWERPRSRPREGSYQQPSLQQRPQTPPGRRSDPHGESSPPISPRRLRAELRASSEPDGIPPLRLFSAPPALAPIGTGRPRGNPCNQWRPWNAEYPDLWPSAPNVARSNGQNLPSRGSSSFPPLVLSPSVAAATGSSGGSSQTTSREGSQSLPPSVPLPSIVITPPPIVTEANGENLRSEGSQPLPPSVATSSAAAVTESSGGPSQNLSSDESQSLSPSATTVSAATRTESSGGHEGNRLSEGSQPLTPSGAHPSPDSSETGSGRGRGQVRGETPPQPGAPQSSTSNGTESGSGHEENSQDSGAHHSTAPPNAWSDAESDRRIDLSIEEFPPLAPPRPPPAPASKTQTGRGRRKKGNKGTSDDQPADKAEGSKSMPAFGGDGACDDPERISSAPGLGSDGTCDDPADEPRDETPGPQGKTTSPFVPAVASGSEDSFAGMASPDERRDENLPPQEVTTHQPQRWENATASDHRGTSNTSIKLSQRGISQSSQLAGGENQTGPRGEDPDFDFASQRRASSRSSDRESNAQKTHRLYKLAEQSSCLKAISNELRAEFEQESGGEMSRPRTPEEQRALQEQYAETARRSREPSRVGYRGSNDDNGMPSMGRFAAMTEGTAYHRASSASGRSSPAQFDASAWGIPGPSAHDPNTSRQRSRDPSQIRGLAPRPPPYRRHSYHEDLSEAASPTSSLHPVQPSDVETGIRDPEIIEESPSTEIEQFPELEGQQSGNDYSQSGLVQDTDPSRYQQGRSGTTTPGFRQRRRSGAITAERPGTPPGVRRGRSGTLIPTPVPEDRPDQGEVRRSDEQSSTQPSTQPSNEDDRYTRLDDERIGHALNPQDSRLEHYVRSEEIRRRRALEALREYREDRNLSGAPVTREMIIEERTRQWRRGFHPSGWESERFDSVSGLLTPQPRLMRRRDSRGNLLYPTRGSIPNHWQVLSTASGESRALADRGNPPSLRKKDPGRTRTARGTKSFPGLDGVDEREDDGNESDTEDDDEPQSQAASQEGAAQEVVEEPSDANVNSDGLEDEDLFSPEEEDSKENRSTSETRPATELDGARRSSLRNLRRRRRSNQLDWTAESQSSMPSSAGSARQGTGSLGGSSQSMAQSSQNGQPQPNQQQVNGVGAAHAAAAGMPNGMVHSGHQSDVNYLWGVVQELSEVLAQNRAQTAAIIGSVHSLRERAAREDGEDGIDGEGNGDEISEERLPGVREVNGEIRNNQAAELANLQQRLHSLQSQLSEAHAENADYASLILDYETTLEDCMRRVRNYAYEHAKATVATHKHYAALLEQEREANLQLRLEHGQWQASMGRAAEWARKALRERSEEVSPLERRNKELRVENKALRKMVGWDVRDDESESEDENGGIKFDIGALKKGESEIEAAGGSVGAVAASTGEAGAAEEAVGGATKGASGLSLGGSEVTSDDSGAAVGTKG